MTLFEVARYLTDRLASIFLRDAEGRRPVFGGVERFQRDLHWRDYLLFYEYFHGDNGAGIGDNGAGIGASHQTGWTGLIAPLLYVVGVADPGTALASRAGLGGFFPAAAAEPVG